MTTTFLAFIPSPSQGVWHLFGVLPIRAYALCIIAGIISALVIGDRRWTARGGEQGIIYDVALWAVPFGLIGGRLYHVMTDWPKYFGADGAGFLAALRIWDGGLGIWGAVALGGVGAWIACRRRDIPLPAFGDAIAPGIILAQAIGRLGNYFNQELYGRATDLPWGLTIYERLDPSGVLSPHSLDGVSTGQVYAVVHPTFLYELIWNLLIFALLIWADRRFKLGHGRLFALYVAGYCVGRFWVELMRSDTASLIAGIRINTFTSSFVFIAAVVYLMVAPKGREDAASLRGKDRDESAIDELGKELTVVAATSGVVAAAKIAGDEDEKASAPGAVAPDSPGIAVEGTEVAVALNAGAEPEPKAATEDGLGSVDADEVGDAKDGATEVHDAAVDGAAEAESLAAEASTEEVAAAEATGDDAVAEEPVVDEHPVGGVGVVEGDDASAAEESAAEVHGAAFDGAVEAQATADDVSVEESVAGEPVVDEHSVGGVGAVEGDDASAAEESAAEVHEAAVDGAVEAQATADDVSVEESVAGEPVADEHSVGGVGAVEGDDASAAEESAAEVHEAAVDGAAEAQATADDVSVEESVEEPVVDEHSVGGVGAVEGDDASAAEESAAEVHEAAVEGAAEVQATADDVSVEADEPVAGEPVVDEHSVGGVGVVEGDDASAAEESAAEAHESAVDSAVEAQATADDAAAAAEERVDEVEDLAVEEPAAETEAIAEEPVVDEHSVGGVGAVEGDDASAAEESAAEVHEAAVDGAAEAQATADDAATDEPAPTKPPAAQSPRRRWWRRG